MIIEPPNQAGKMIHTTGTGDVLSMGMILLHGRTDLPIRTKLQLSNRNFIEGRRPMIPTL